jgi:catechol 2,3-dioxygenase-like lactoylglutathione lyase family enzyme
MPDRSGFRSPFDALHHIAVITNDMAATVSFYQDILCSEVVMAHRSIKAGARHYFITVAPNVVFAVFEFQDAKLPEWTSMFLEDDLPKRNRLLEHICFCIESETNWLALRDRLTAHGVEVRSPPSGRKAFFFADPNNITFGVQLGDPHPHSAIHNDPEPAYIPPAK